jgi:DNA-binding FadR family transcriptional regulator
MSIETMASEFAALRHTEADLEKIKKALLAFEVAVENEQSTHQQDYDFHFAIAAASQNPYYLQLYRQFHKDAIPRMKALNVNNKNQKTKAYTKRIHKEHLAIYSAIEARDAIGARTAMYEHLNRSHQLYSNAL